MPVYRHTFGSKSEKSKKKVRAEEFIIITTLPQGQLFILSKGTGRESELAARVIATGIRHYLQTQSQPFTAHLLNEAFQYAQRQLNDIKEKNEDIGESDADLTVLAIHENQLFYLSTGKNLLLIGNPPPLTQLLPSESSEGDKPIFVTEQPLLLKHGDMLLLCTHAIDTIISEKILYETLFNEELSAQSKAEKIVSFVQEKNAEEGFSAIVIHHFQIPEDPTSYAHNASVDEVSVEVTDPKLARLRRQTFIAFTVFVVFILMLYFNKTQRWERAIQQLDSLERVTQQQQKKLQLLERQEKLRIENIRNHYFDSFDNDKYRLYGLLRDSEKKYKISEISTMFNIFNTNAIKVSEVMGEQWYIVPVKAVHFMQAGETATTLAQKYYSDPADSILIKKFNHQLTPYRHVFIPFNK